MDHQEIRIQQDCFIWFNNTYCLHTHTPQSIIFHVPNEQQHRLTGVGVMAGVSDLVVIHKGIVLFIEVKTPTGKQSPKQQVFERLVIGQGYAYHIVRSSDQFKAIITGL